jgi:protein gp37/ParB-like chromosome segregation protein Spo0J
MSEFGRYKVHPAAEDFPFLDAERRAELAADIRAHGQRTPILVTADGSTIVEGRNRYLACNDAGVEPKIKRLGKLSELEIVRLIWSLNGARRDLEQGQRAAIFVLNHERQTKLIEEEAKERQREGNKQGGKTKAGQGRKSVARVPQTSKKQKTRQLLADKAGVGERTMGKAKRLHKANRKRLKQVAAGKITLADAVREQNAADKENRVPKEPTAISNKTTIIRSHDGEEVAYPLPKSKPTFNQTNDQVGWAYWTWNPVTGCLHNCRYCYAREGAVVNENLSKHYPFGFKPSFYEYRLTAPVNTALPADVTVDPRKGRVFVTSMGDLFGKWVPDEWIDKVMAQCISNPQWEYLFLSKFPQRYVGLQLPPTAWIGTTVDDQYRVKIAEEAFRKIEGVRVKWLSLEPLLAPLEFSDLSMFDWIVIGSQSATEQPDGRVTEFAPPFEWVAQLTEQAHAAGCKVFQKANLLGVTDSQHAGMKLIQQIPDLPPLLRAQAELELSPAA